MKVKILILVLAYLFVCALLFVTNSPNAIVMLCIGIFLLCIVACVWIANKLAKRTQWYKSVIPNMSLYPTNEWYRKHLERNFDVVNIGSSSAKYAFDYSDLPVKAFNWGEQPQLLGNGFKILKTYFSILKKGGTVIISLGPMSGLDVEGKWNKTANDKYYYTLPSELIDNYKTVARRRKYPLLYMPVASIKSILKKVLGKEKTDSSLTQKKKFVDNSDVWIFNWKNEFGIESLDAPLSSINATGQEKRAALLSDILSFCVDRDLRPVIVIPPMHGSLSSKFTPTFKKNYIYNFIHKANARNVPFLNYMDDERFHDDRYFLNSFFMSEEGAKKFTRIVLKEIDIV